MNAEDSESLNSNILLFTGYFFETIGRINNIRDDSATALENPLVRESVNISNSLKCSLLRKILFMGVIDTLSHAAFPSMERENHQRVVKFLDTCTGWADRDRVSTPLALRALKRNNLGTTGLCRFIGSHLSLWRDGAILEPEADLKLSEILKHAANKQEETLVLRRTYKELFYAYRNKLVHEFREPGNGIDFAKHGVPGGKETPYYHGMIGTDPDTTTWHLVFPEAFVSKLCQDSVAGTKQFLLANEIDPYANFDFGPDWE